MHEDGGSDEDGNVSGGGVKEVVSGDASGVDLLTTSLFMFILPSSRILESDVGDDRGK